MSRPNTDAWVQWNLLIRQQIKPEPEEGDWFRYQDLPAIINRIETARTVAMGLRLFTNGIEFLTACLEPFARQKRGIDRFL